MDATSVHDASQDVATVDVVDDLLETDVDACLPIATTTHGTTFATASADGTVLSASNATPSVCQTCASDYTCECVLGHVFPFTICTATSIAGCHIVVAHGGMQGFVEVTCQ